MSVAAAFALGPPMLSEPASSVTAAQAPKIRLTAPPRVRLTGLLPRSRCSDIAAPFVPALGRALPSRPRSPPSMTGRSEEHTSELQSRRDLVCRLLLEKKKKQTYHAIYQKNKKNTTTL